MATGNTDKFRQNKIRRKLLLLNKEWYFYEPLNTNVRGIKSDYFAGSNSCYIQFTYGFGASEQTKREEFPAADLDIWIKRFQPKKDLTDNFALPHQKTETASIAEKPKPTIMEESKSTRTVHSLREHLFDAMISVKSKEITAEQGRAMAQIAQTIINSAKIELEYKKAISEKPSVPLLN